MNVVGNPLECFRRSQTRTSGSIFLSTSSRPTVIPRSHYINKIRDLNYTFKERKKRVELWRKRGSTHYISVPHTELLEEDFVISTLRQAGCADADIRAFIASATS